MKNDILKFKENGILKIVLNRPKKRNALTIGMYSKLIEIFQHSIMDDDIYVVILTGSGSFFSSGNDFNSLLTKMDEELLEDETMISIFKNFVDTLITYPKLLIAIVNGPAIGIAATMLPLFDLVYTSDTAYFQTPFTKLGLSAEGCSTYTFPRLFGYSKAADMLYLCSKMTASEAKQYGLVSEVYKHDCLDEIWTSLKKLSQFSSESIIATKRLVRRWSEKMLLEANAEESRELEKRLQSTDFMNRVVKIMFHKSKL